MDYLILQKVKQLHTPNYNYRVSQQEFAGAFVLQQNPEAEYKCISL